jgi:hypothetical protein
MEQETYQYLPKEYVEEPYYSVADAMSLTGYSATKFRYEPNKRELDRLGSDCSKRVWRIPRSALVQMDWLSPDAPMQPVIEAPEVQGEQRSSVARILELAEENTLLKERLAVAEARLADKDAEIERLMGLLHR